MTNSRAKGCVGERELSKELTRLFGSDCRRGQQFCGANGDADVVGLHDDIHIECKRVERLNLQEAMSQAVRDGGPDKLPLVCHRKNRGDWMATVLLDDVPRLVRLLGEMNQRGFE